MLSTSKHRRCDTTALVRDIPEPFCRTVTKFGCKYLAEKIERIYNDRFLLKHHCIQ